MKMLETVAKKTVVEEVFVGEESCPAHTNVYDFFMEYKNEQDELCDTELANKWGYQAHEEYGLENIHDLRGVMQSKFDSLLAFHKKASEMQMMNRDIFMEYFRSDRFSEELSADDKTELFLGSLGGGSDITKELLEELLGNYGVASVEIK